MFAFFSDSIRAAALTEIMEGVESGATGGWFLHPEHLGAFLSILAQWQIEVGSAQEVDFAADLAGRVATVDGATVLVERLLPLVAANCDTYQGWQNSMAGVYGFSQQRVAELVSMYLEALSPWAWRLSGGDLGRIAEFGRSVQADYAAQYSVAF